MISECKTCNLNVVCDIYNYWVENKLDIPKTICPCPDCLVFPMCSRECKERIEILASIYELTNQKTKLHHLKIIFSRFYPNYIPPTD